MTNDKYLWDRLISAGYRPEAAAGILGNIRAESNFRPDNLQNTYEKILGMTDKEYTAAINSGAYSYRQFIEDHAGYGLAQWTYKTRKAELYKYCFPDIGSLEKQADYLLKEIGWYSALQAILKTGTLRECSDAVLHLYEAPGDQSEAVELRRYGYAKEIYDKYAAGTVYSWQLNAYKVRDNAYAYAGSVPGSFVIEKEPGLFAVCYGAYETEAEAADHKTEAKRYSKKAFIIKLTNQEVKV